MPNPKHISLATADGAGLAVYAIVRRDSDGWLLDDADGSFAAAPADSYVSLTEHATIKGLYERSESRFAWDDGACTITAFRQSGGSPAPASDTIIATGRMFTRGDAEILPSGFSTLSAADVNAEVASALVDYDPPTKAGLAAATANLDAAVSSRATPADLTGALTPCVFQPSPGISSSQRQRIIRGDAATLRFSLGPAWNLTGRLAYFMAKVSPSEENSAAMVNRACAITEALTGQCEITLTPEETATVGLYHAEVEVRNADDSGPLTALQFQLLIAQDVRQ